MEEDYISKLKHVSKLDFQSKVDVINTGRPTPELKVDWSWASWQLWGGCSDSCGGGERMRVRLCNSPPRGNGGRPCPGDSSQLSRCNAHACPGGPQSARGSIVGNINDIEFGISILNATVTDGQSGGRTVTATITNVPRTLGPAMRTLVSILNPVYWTAAQEVGEAVNALTGSVFRRETQVEFATGETLRMTLAARGLDSDGALLLDIVVNGHVLQLPSHADISIKTVQEFNSLVALYREQLISVPAGREDQAAPQEASQRRHQPNVSIKGDQRQVGGGGTSSTDGSRRMLRATPVGAACRRSPLRSIGRLDPGLLN
ncbi:hemicentin-1-like isoform X4 [Pseudoliparis swirei]|uniref:hemicentin-1-like isoform X4 n=1 Tax=Pseudoliparis swirei TaxID=2059687 RepID=UPI0024BE3B88|nr:hemicentin-1-like isoform X4 [Pseudoliparis swirei]